MAILSAPEGAQQLQIVIGAEPPDRLDKALAREVPEEASLSRSRLAKMIAAGEVWHNGAPLTDTKAKLVEGDVLTLYLTAPVDLEAQPQDIPLEVLYEDDDLIVVNKPVGMVVHPAPGTPDGTLVNALLSHCADTLSGIGGAKRPGIVHRIDKDTSGLLVVAKTDRAHHGLAAQFAAHTVTRRYLAVIHGVPSAADPRLRGTAGVSFESGGILKIATNLDRHRTDRQRQAVTQHGGRHAVTRARVLESFEVASLVECWLETGRTHQIRVHMSHVGHGLLGDQTYGGKRKVAAKALGAAAAEAAATFPRQALHAATLGFVHPGTGEELAFEAPLPQDIDALLAVLRRGKDDEK
ncbi:RluA family pseudouridine synthase [Falsirhodobacter sp. alg1]|uniref:RluA family pseudouridine synthase n=1 Tax=Falsirhodobacter sp. alg1 TaxID=1472418 RepID=UPI0005EDC808|nr:RluA family pseudouridine synthase [Falsirhodobacter sp. alg1]